MKLVSRMIFVLLALSLLSEVAHAACYKAQVCDDSGMNCRVRDICERSVDLPPVEPAPLTPLPSNSVKPLPSIELPPSGASHCEYMQVNGRWQTVCR